MSNVEDEMRREYEENMRLLWREALGPDDEDDEQERLAFAAEIRKLHQWMLSMREAGHVPDDIMATWTAHFDPASCSYDGMDDD